jgi:hypothetical protein
MLLEVAKKFSKMIVDDFQRIASPPVDPLASRATDWHVFQID